MSAPLRLAGLLMLLSLASGCTTVSWTNVKESHTSGPDKSFTVDLPVGWVRAPANSDAVLITRDGLGVQYIRVERRDSKDAFPKIKKASKPDIEPNELAELMIAEIKASARSPVEVMSNQPTGIAQRIGVRLQLQTRTAEGLRYQMVVYGLVDARGFYELTYHAPMLYYFQRDLPTFERVVQSFRVAGKKTS
jgi:hypothetical protein